MTIELARTGPLAALTLTLALSACKSAPKEITMEVKQGAPAKGEIAFEVKTEPGAWVYVYRSTKKPSYGATSGNSSKGARADSNGNATVAVYFDEDSTDPQTYHVSASHRDEPKVKLPVIKELFKTKERKVEKDFDVTAPWKFDGGRCRGTGPKCTVSLDYSGNLKVTAPDGTKITWGKAAATVAGGNAQLGLGDDVLFTVPVSVLHEPQGGAGVTVPYTLTFPTGQTATGSTDVARKLLQERIVARLRPVEKGTGVAFPGDDAAPEKPRAAFYMYRKRLFGEAQRLSDVDLIVVTDDKTRTSSCGTYTASSGSSISYSITYYDENIKLVDRRTGRVVSQRFFRAPPERCPTSFSAKAGANAGTSSFPDRAQVEAFIAAAVPPSPARYPDTPGAAAPAPAPPPAASADPAASAAPSAPPAPTAPAPTAPAPTTPPAAPPKPTTTAPPKPAPAPTPTATAKKPPAPIPKKPTIKKK